MDLSNLPSILIYVVILLFSVIFHEVAHGLMAERLGDSTARDAGRLTFNPIPHIDWLWSIVIPLILIISHSPIVFGSAKPVPVDFRNLRNLRWGMLLVSIAGPATNFALALLAAVVLRAAPHISSMAQNILVETMTLNLVLCFFNLIPIPPLDGSKILASLAGYINRAWMHSMLAMERYGFIILVIFLYLGLVQTIILPPVTFFLSIFLGPNIPTGF
jgi:Zn-dependent protease